MRHGTYSGYTAGCHEWCCRREKLRYQERLRADHNHGKRRMVDSAGTLRRLRGLMRLGYSLRELSVQMGHSPSYLSAIIGQWGVHAGTAEAVRQLTKRLVQQPLPKGGYAERRRRDAEAKGYLPLAVWNDIDNPHETPDMEALAC